MAPKDSKITAGPKALASLHRLEILSDSVCFTINLVWCFVVQAGRRSRRALAILLIRLKRSRFVECTRRVFQADVAAVGLGRPSQALYVSAMRLIVVACYQIVRNDSEIAAYTVISMMLPMSAESDGVPADESPTLYFASCRSSSLDLEVPPWSMSVSSRVLVSDGWLSRRFAQLLSPSTDGNILISGTLPFPAR